MTDFEKRVAEQGTTACIYCGSEFDTANPCCCDSGFNDGLHINGHCSFCHLQARRQHSRHHNRCVDFGVGWERETMTNRLATWLFQHSAVEAIGVASGAIIVISAAGGYDWELSLEIQKWVHDTVSKQMILCCVKEGMIK